MKDTIFNSKISFNCQGILHEFDKPLIMGILNTTPDSFYEGSRKSENKAILEQTDTFIKQGVDIIDVGGYSSRPGATNITEIEELNRVIPAIQLIRDHFPNILISIDSFRAKIAKEAILNGANIINDITGGQFDTDIYKIAAKYSAPYIMMHMKGTPQNMQQNTTYKHLIKELIYFFSKQINLAEFYGVKDLFIDPGLGFSKTLEQNYSILKHLNKLNILDKPILIGTSRKSMIYKLLNVSPNEALNGTTVVNTIALMNGAHILRVHDVKEAVEIKKIYCQINEHNH